MIMRQGSSGHGEDFTLVEFMLDARVRLHRKVIIFTVMPLGMLEHRVFLFDRVTTLLVSSTVEVSPLSWVRCFGGVGNTRIPFSCGQLASGRAVEDHPKGEVLAGILEMVLESSSVKEAISGPEC